MRALRASWSSGDARCGCIGSSCLQPSEQQFEPAGKLELSRRARQHCVPVPGWASGGLLVGSVWRCTCEPCSERWYLSSLDPLLVLGCRGSRAEAVEAPNLSKVNLCVRPTVATCLHYLLTTLQAYSAVRATSRLGTSKVSQLVSWLTGTNCAQDFSNCNHGYWEFQ